jgi:hypothetical protein
MTARKSFRLAVLAAAMLAAALVALVASNRPAAPADSHSATGSSAAAAPAAAAAGGLAPPVGRAPEPVDRPSPHLFRYLPHTQAADGSFALQWQPADFAELRAGDAFTLELPMSRATYKARVNEAIDVPGGRRLTGRLHDGGVESWPFSMTILGDGRTVVGNISAYGRKFALQIGKAGASLRDTTDEGHKLFESEREFWESGRHLGH